MIKRSIYKYITSNPNNDYALEVLYYHVKKALLQTDFNLKNTYSLSICEKYLGEKVEIIINGTYTTYLDSIALLLSIRALMLDKYLLPKCNNDCLMFKNGGIDPYEWLSFYDIINQHYNDEDFRMLLNLLIEVKSINKISSDNIKIFKTGIKQPIAKNLIKYYQNLADSEDEIIENVICNNAFAFNNTLYEYLIPVSIEYIGNTAFAFCENLERLVFTNPNMKIGKFPIIECPKLKHIIVPENSEQYYKDLLPYYADIIYHQVEDKKNVEVDNNDNNNNNAPIIEADNKVYIKEEQASDDKTITAVEIDLLFSTFNRKSTSYKYFWFLSILSLIKENLGCEIPYKDISVKMISLAWPYVSKGVDFGKTDKLKELVSYIIANTSLSLQDTSDRVFEYLVTIKNSEIYNKLFVLMQNVPYRFLSPWIKFTTNQEVKLLSQKVRSLVPYVLYDESIVVDEKWMNFMLLNISSLYKRTKDCLTDYLKVRNSIFILKQI